MTTYSGAKGRRALVVGLGISGMATAIRLRKAGWEPVIVERAPARRTGGYFIALFDPGRRAAERLGILGDMHDRYPPDCVGWIEDRAGNRKPGLVFPPGIRPYMLLRTDVERAAFENLPPDVEIRYSTTPIHIAQDDTGVEVTLDQNGAAVTERFDLVVGADGLRSTVRRLVFGPHEQCLHRLGYMITAFTLPAPIGGYAGNEIVSLFEPDRSLWLIPFKDHPPAVLFSYRTDDVDAQFRGRPVDRIREAYGPEPPGCLLGEAIAALEAADHYVFDSVEQVRIDNLYRGRVVLVGDAAWCAGLYSGMGASSGLVGAELLGTMLEHHRHDVAAALAAWEDHLRPLVARIQRMGVQRRFFFTPGSRMQIALRPVAARAFQLPLVGGVLHRVMRPGQGEGDDLFTVKAAA